MNFPGGGAYIFSFRGGDSAPVGAQNPYFGHINESIDSCISDNMECSVKIRKKGKNRQKSLKLKSVEKKL